MEFTEPGTLDLKATQLRLGGLLVSSDSAALEKGNKFIVVEHFVDPQGQPIDAVQFDSIRMCYSLFVSPESKSHGRHSNVLGHHTEYGKIGRIVGGGLLQVFGTHQALLSDFSGDFDAEPQSIRQKLAGLLLPELQKIRGADTLTMEVARNSPTRVNYYWFRFRQVLEQFRDHYTADPAFFDRCVGLYRKEEERHVRNSVVEMQKKP